MDCTGNETYSIIAQDHAARPRNLGPLTEYNGHARITGACGDTMEFWLMVNNGILEQVAFITDGCGSSLACGSMTTCLAQGKPIEAALNLRQRDVLLALKGIPLDSRHCALLATNTLKAACLEYLKHHEEPSPSLNPAFNK